MESSAHEKDELDLPKVHQLRESRKKREELLDGMEGGKNIYGGAELVNSRDAQIHLGVTEAEDSTFAIISGGGWYNTIIHDAGHSKAGTGSGSIDPRVVTLERRWVILGMHAKATISGNRGWILLVNIYYYLGVALAGGKIRIGGRLALQGTGEVLVGSSRDSAGSKSVDQVATNQQSPTPGYPGAQLGSPDLLSRRSPLHNISGGQITEE
ncbi:predicted protein [Histoplasma capsulatum G186AR]|uniref:Uncharacterized protein n=1 Tax=Ajellomyces capsulatus (strain G186AR / H82 / ATCC MYA-2454 / RMSCC 2432) TaxID=447093 RepID=C0NPM6_AJECG|nr:uncharacterized protein HCBG_05106 [Histoplasma capsulatum G186AR]EEH06886.1 predicted protein [Histoplasma capsulatum G186AR]